MDPPFPKPEFSHQIAEVVLTSEQVRRGGDVHEQVDLAGAQLGVVQGGAGGSEGKVTVVEAAVGPRALAPTTELVVESAFVDGEMPHHPLGFEQPSVGPGWAQVAENLLVGDPVLGQKRPHTEYGDSHF